MCQSASIFMSHLGVRQLEEAQLPFVFLHPTNVQELSDFRFVMATKQGFCSTLSDGLREGPVI